MKYEEDGGVLTVGIKGTTPTEKAQLWGVSIKEANKLRQTIFGNHEAPFLSEVRDDS